jgi:glutamate N-acetyltransferase / amino-acid N-acetyltransferase
MGHGGTAVRGMRAFRAALTSRRRRCDGHDATVTDLPLGFSVHTANVGIKDDTTDFCVIACDRPAVAAAVFTKSVFAGASVDLSRRHVADGTLRAVVVISKNANVATGTEGRKNAVEIAVGVGRALRVASSDIVIASTGVIGRQYPMQKVRSHLAGFGPSSLDSRSADDAATAIMTTDTHRKVASSTIAGSTARVVGIAKGVGMIEPDMATLLVFVTTDAEVSREQLDTTFRRVIDRTFNSVSIDTDTSTSDTAVVMASGAAGPVDIDAFEAALQAVCLDLTRQVARDGEGATKLLVVTVDEARTAAEAKRVAKSIVNSPLVKTAVHGADPNWGRVAMAIGKCDGDTDIDPEKVTIRFGTQELYPRAVDDAALAQLTEYLRGDEVLIHVSLATGTLSWTVYGCDLSDQYVRINADYTT